MSQKSDAQLKRLVKAALKARDMLAQIRGWTATHKELRAALEPFLDIAKEDREAVTTEEKAL